MCTELKAHSAGDLSQSYSQNLRAKNLQLLEQLKG